MLNENTNLQHLLEDKNRRIEGIQAELNTKIKEIEDQRKLITNCNKGLQDTKNMMNKITLEKEEMEHKHFEVCKENEYLGNQLKELEQVHDKDIQIVENNTTDINELKEKISELKLIITDKEKEIEI